MSRGVLFALAVLLVASAAGAHALGISRTDLVERPDGSIHGRFTFAASEAPAAFDQDRHVAIEIRTDGRPCTPGPITTSIDGDGLVVDEDFACAKATRSIEAIARFVTRMQGSHEDVAMLETPEATREELLGPDHRALVLELHRAPRAAPRHTRSSALVGAVVAAVALLAIAIRSILRR